MVPSTDIDADAPLMEMFAAHGCMFAKYIVAVGSIAGLTVSLLGSLFPMPRVIYAMAGDGLLFKSVLLFSPFVLNQGTTRLMMFPVFSGSWPTFHPTPRPPP